APDEELRPEEAADWVEHLYLRLAYDESAALPQVAQLFDRARRRRLLGTQHLIVSFTEEQEAILSSAGQAHLHYLRGLTAFDARDFPAARTLLESVDTTRLPARLRQRV